RLVVSDNGDSLSPKIAPEIIAPAVIPKGRFISTAIPIKATPAVADEPQAVPVATETIAVIIKAVTKKYLGSMIKTPQLINIGTVPEYIQVPTMTPTAKIIKIAGMAVFNRVTIPFSISSQVKPTLWAIKAA